MIIVRDIGELRNVGLVATVGFFDGVHQGHRFLIDRMKEQATRLQLKTAVITFPQHPRQVLQKDYQPKLLNSFEEKIEHLEETGIDYCIILNFTLELSRLNARDFIRNILADQLHVKTLFVGYDHRFGHNREEGMEQYQAYGRELGIDVIRADSYQTTDHHISSSEIRRLLLEGKVEDAAALLTYPYQIKGNIVSGFKVGRKLGFPTANIHITEPFKIVPAIGVYAVKVCLGESQFDGMLYIGNRPTLNNGNDITLEVNIFNFSEDIYNNEITVTFIKYIRGDIKFDSLDELKQQLENDRIEVQQVMSYRP